VIALEKLPTLGPGLKEQDTSAEIAASFGPRVPGHGSQGHLYQFDWRSSRWLHRALEPDMDAKGQISNLGFIHRKLADCDIYFVGQQQQSGSRWSIRFRSNRTAVESWDPDSGRVLEAFILGDGARIPLKLAPYESRVFVLRDKAGPRS